MGTTTAGVINARNALLHEMALQLKHEKALVRAQEICASHGMLKLNLGCGPNIRPGWINIDLFARQADLALDLREPWPFRDASVDTIYSEHFFEHLSYPNEVQHLLCESRRVLCAGGLFDVGVPDTEWLMRSWGNPHADYWKYAREIFHPAICRTHMDHINYHFRQEGQHQYAWDWETLHLTLQDAGFVRIEQRSWQEGGDTLSRQLGTLYVTARNPY